MRVVVNQKFKQVDFSEYKYDLSIREMLIELIDMGISGGWIAKQIGVSQPTVHGLYSGESQDMGYERGAKKIEALYTKYVINNELKRIDRD